MNRITLLLLPLISLAACQTQHDVNLATPEPIEINLNIKLELSEEVVALIKEERGSAERGVTVAQRSINSGSTVLEDALAWVEELKTRQLVGESLTGYVVSVNDQASHRAHLALVNEARETEYRRMAAEQNVKLETVERIAAQERIAAEPADHKVMNSNGKFVVKGEL